MPNAGGIGFAIRSTRHGAARSGLPSLGARDPAVGIFNHCASAPLASEREGDQQPMMFDLQDNFLKSQPYRARKKGGKHAGAFVTGERRGLGFASPVRQGEDVNKEIG